MLVEKTKNESFSLYKKVYSALSFKNLLRICGRPNTKYSVVNKLSQPKNGLLILTAFSGKFFLKLCPNFMWRQLVAKFKL